jgi:hypothetical protein
LKAGNPRTSLVADEGGGRQDDDAAGQNMSGTTMSVPSHGPSATVLA